MDTCYDVWYGLNFKTVQPTLQKDTKLTYYYFFNQLLQSLLDY